MTSQNKNKLRGENCKKVILFLSFYLTATRPFFDKPRQKHGITKKPKVLKNLLTAILTEDAKLNHLEIYL